MKDFIKNICDWADDKGLTEYGIMNSQFAKIREEIEELRCAISENNLLEIKDAIGDIFVTLIVAKQMELKDSEKVCKAIYTYSIDKVVGEYGDDAYRFLVMDLENMDFVRNGGNYIGDKFINSMIGTLFVTAMSYGMELVDCVEHAYQIISKRTGKIINGSFVKDGKED